MTRPSSRVRSTSRVADCSFSAAGEARDEPGAFARGDIGERQALIDHSLGRAPDPAGERAVDVQQRAVGGHRGKADRRAVELGELHLDAGDTRRLALAIGGDVGEAPQHQTRRCVGAFGGERVDGELQRAARALARHAAVRWRTPRPSASPRSAARVRRNSAELAAASPARNCCRPTRRSRSPRPTIVSKAELAYIGSPSRLAIITPTSRPSAAALTTSASGARWPTRM